MEVPSYLGDFPITRDIAYLNVANHSPPSGPVKRAIQDFLEWLGKELGS